MSSPNYIEAAQSFFKLTGLKKGSHVRVTHKVPSHQHGWGCSWNDHVMDAAVGKTYKVESICSYDYDIGIELNGDIYHFPFFCLEVVDSPTIEVKLDSGDYKAIIKENGDVEVGCQEISYGTIETIFKHAYESKYDCELILPK